ncbi:MAG: transcriptional repressor [Ruminococcaceae bacterium]|nr:transcriptional repressor [Oscillospiraceae bacterium]
MSGQNFSKKRQMILDTIRSTDTHPSAKWVYETLKEQIPDLSLGTVYRNINLFKEQGLIIPVATVDGEERIDGDTSAHAHFVCKECGCVYDVPATHAPISQETCALDGFCTHNTVLTYYGICGGCTEL